MTFGNIAPKRSDSVQSTTINTHSNIHNKWMSNAYSNFCFCPSVNTHTYIHKHDDDDDDVAKEAK